MEQVVMASTSERGGQVDVVPLGPTVRRIALRGALPVGWAGRLASGLAAQRISVVRGWAQEHEDGGWDAQLQVELPQYTVDLTPAAVFQLTAPEAGPLRSALDGLELLSYRLTPAGPDVVVEIEGADARGFLDRVLRLFALHGLFPREMSVETSDGMVHDVFRLRSLHGGGPEPATVAALQAKLKRVTVP